MGLCSGKGDVVSQTSNNTLDIAVPGRKTSDTGQDIPITGKCVIPTSEMIEKKARLTNYHHELSNKVACRMPRYASENFNHVNDDSNRNKNGPSVHAVHRGNDSTEEINAIFRTNDETRSDLNEGNKDDCNQITISKYYTEQYNEWLEVANIDELHSMLTDKDGIISLIESENDYEFNHYNIKPVEKTINKKISTCKNKAEMPKNVDSKVTHMKVKHDKHVINHRKTGNKKLKTRNLLEKDGWQEEKVYTTQGKDGVLFRIRVLRQAPGKGDIGNANVAREQRSKFPSDITNILQKIQTTDEDGDSNSHHTAPIEYRQANSVPTPSPAAQISQATSLAYVNADKVIYLIRHRTPSSSQPSRNSADPLQGDVHNGKIIW